MIQLKKGVEDMKRKIMYVLIAVLIIIAAIIAVISLSGVQVVNISLEEDQYSDSFKMVFNIPVETGKIELVKLGKDEGIWLGEYIQQIENLDISVFEIILHDINISDELRKEAGKSSVSRSTSLDVLPLADGIEYVITYPPDDSMTAIYLFIENRIVDMKGLNLESSHFIKEVEINIGKECKECFQPKFVSYTQNSYETVNEFKMVKQHTIDKTGNDKYVDEVIDMPYDDYVEAEWFGNIDFTDDMKSGILSEVFEKTGVEHFGSRDIYDYGGKMYVDEGDKGYLEFWFEGGETQGFLKYSLLDEFNNINYYEMPMSAILFSSSTDVTSKAWSEKKKIQIERDSQLDEFMKGFMNKDKGKVLEMIGLTDFNLDFLYDDKMESDIREAYGFINDFELTGYEILESNNEEHNVMKYIVMLEVSESSIEFIPEGNSAWDVEIGIDGPGLIQLFKPHEMELIHARSSSRNLPESFAYRVATYLQVFNTLDDFNDIVPDSDSEELFFDRFCINLMMMFRDRFENGYVTAERLSEEVEMALGITDVDFTQHSHYDPETDSMSLREGGGSWMYESLVSVDFDEETGIHTVVLDFYTDAAFMFKAKTMKYEVMDMGEDGFKMISAELIYDSGCDPFMDCV